jgi:hypothetical protein
MDFFISAICINSKVTVRLYDRMSDFYDAYLGENYSTTAQFGESSLHGSCMKNEDTARNAADFYRNFAGAKIIVARDAQQNILGRAIVWEQVTDEKCEMKNSFSVLDRIYFSHDFIITLIRDHARSIGIHLRKKQNTHSSSDEFVVMNGVDAPELAAGQFWYCRSLKIKVPATRWHKKGAPYMDTFFTLSLHEDGCFYLGNGSDDSDCFAVCRNTGGFATVEKNVCPSCNWVHKPKNDEQLCPDCMERYCTETVFGNVVFGRPVEYKGKRYPSFLFRKGKPNMNFRKYMQIRKLYAEC